MANSMQIPLRPKLTDYMKMYPTDEQMRKHHYVRTPRDDKFSPPFSEMTSISASVVMMQSFENIYLSYIDSLEKPNTPDKPFPTNASRTEAFIYAKNFILALENKHEPALIDLDMLPTVDEFDADTVFREIHEQIASEEAKHEAGRLWNEIYFEYVIKRNKVEHIRDAWHSELEHLVREHHTVFSGLVEEEQKVFLKALNDANSEKSVLSWIAMCGPRSSSIYALAQLSLSSP